MDIPTIIIAVLAGVLVFQMMGLLNPKETIVGSMVPGEELYVDSKHISKTTPIVGIKQLVI